MRRQTRPGVRQRRFETLTADGGHQYLMIDSTLERPTRRQPAEKETKAQATGRSRGAPTTRTHRRADAPAVFLVVKAGQRGDGPDAEPQLDGHAGGAASLTRPMMPMPCAPPPRTWAPRPSGCRTNPARPPSPTTPSSPDHKPRRAVLQPPECFRRFSTRHGRPTIRFCGFTRLRHPWSRRPDCRAGLGDERGGRRCGLFAGLEDAPWAMCATGAPRRQVRQAVPHRQKPPRVRAKHDGIGPKTVAKWKNRPRPPIGPKEPKASVLSAGQEAAILAFRRHTLLPLDGGLPGLQATIWALTRPSRYQRRQRPWDELAAGDPR